MSDIQKSFTFLQDAIPKWLQDITAIEDKVIALREEMVKVPVGSSPFAKRPSESIESTPRGRMAAIAEDDAPSHGAQTDPAGNRKRKTLSVLSGHASGPLKYRARTMVVVSYDGDIQKSFELMVRAIGTGRNLLRKAKMEAKMQELAALAGSSDEDDGSNNEDQDDANIMAKVSFKPSWRGSATASMRAQAASRTGGRPGASGAASVPVALFDTTDKILENAQSVCETAAHLIIRDGDCRKELASVRKSVTDVLETARNEVARYAAAKPQELQEPPQGLEAEDTPATSVSSIDPFYQKHFPQISTPPPLPRPLQESTSTTGLKTMDIEVDSKEESDDEIFVPPVRFTSRLAANRG